MNEKKPPATSRHQNSPLGIRRSPKRSRPERQIQHGRRSPCGRAQVPALNQGESWLGSCIAF